MEMNFTPNTCKEPVALVQSVGLTTTSHVDIILTLTPRNNSRDLRDYTSSFEYKKVRVFFGGFSSSLNSVKKVSGTQTQHIQYTTSSTH